MTMLLQKYLSYTHGCIVNVSGTWGSQPKDGYLGYAVCKAGIESLTKSSAIELAPLGIRVNCVSPSTVDTNMYLYMGMTEPKYARFKDESRWKIPLWQKDDSNKLQPRIANVAEIANAIIFLTAEESKKITGHIMKVDGGKSLTTSDFEPKFDKLDKSILPSLLSKPGAQKPDLFPKYGTQGFEQWVENTIKESNWSTHHEDAHFKVNQDYRQEEMDTDKLNHGIMMHAEGGGFNPKRANRVNN